MSELNKLLDKAKKTLTVNSDAALAVALGLKRQSIFQWRQGGVITEKHLTALVALAQAEPRVVIAVLQEQATTGPGRSVWGALARQLGVAAVVTLCAVVTPGKSAPLASAASTVAELGVPIMSKKRRRWSRRSPFGERRAA